jgi:hypothetical protein
MERTRFTVRGHEFSVIYGTGSYGESLKLLEAILPESQEPEGDLTASEILEVVDEWRGLGNL